MKLTIKKMVKMKTITNDDEEKYQENEDVEIGSEDDDEEDEVGIRILLTNKIIGAN